MNIVCIVQARVGSTRLPRKVLKKICGKTILEHDIDRLKRVKNIDKIVIATTTEKKDIEIVNETNRLGITCFRGSEKDVLSRYYYAAKENNADIVVRITSDCPLLDCRITENTINYYLENSYDYVSNTLERTLPRGLDTEVFSFNILEKAFNEAILDRDREHVTSYIYTSKDKFSLGSYRFSKDYSNHRWTLDTEEDFNFISCIYNELYKKNKYFDMNDILNLLNRRADLLAINKDINQKEI
ncbi:cytidylyltransferase domain-containing protein [Clostridium intestinale]|uniref:Putative polysaccharide biosynthesis cytidylyltransferase n=1 Tax=Clostridium intestinale URNW TaxID=1294142 RepID=U2NHG2_9CLOT|nr:glycosyltransferase family protein [Clostridium intestinale]ERK28533.1 putative polysaccharide biosynthesis cytidylyltransferase [Clostridium intestinale URNW]